MQKKFIQFLSFFWFLWLEGNYKPNTWVDLRNKPEKSNEPKKPASRSLAEDGEEYRQYNADNDARGERKVEAELFSFDKDVPWQTPNVRDLVGEGDREA